MKGLTVAQWINLNWNNESVNIPCSMGHSPTTSGLYGRLLAGRQVGRQIYRLDYLAFYFCSYNAIIVLPMHFSCIA